MNYFDYSVRFEAIKDGTANYFDVSKGDIVLSFHFKTNTDMKVDFVPNTDGETTLGFRLFSTDMSKLIYESRVAYDKFAALPNQWLPFILVLPVSVLDGVGSALLVFDLLIEKQFWFADRGGPKYSFLLEFTDSGGGRGDAKVVEANPEPRSEPAELVDPPKHPATTRTLSQGQSDCLRSALTTDVRSALSHCFRMKASLIDASPEVFRAHCYRSLLRRDPDPAIVGAPIVFANLRARIAYWRDMVLSAEFGAGETVPPRDEVVLRIQESLGWSVANTLLGYALRIESVTAGTFLQFVHKLSDYLVDNSYSSSDIEHLFESGEPTPKHSVLFEGLIDLAVEFSLGISRLGELVTRVENLARRVPADMSAAIEHTDTNADSHVTIAPAEVVEVPSALELSAAASRIGAFVDFAPPLPLQVKDSVDSTSLRRRKPTRWAPP